jgi:hypothetical protein
MTLRRPPHQTDENNAIDASLQGAAFFWGRIADDFLEPAVHDGGIQPAASSLSEKNPF